MNNLSLVMWVSLSVGACSHAPVAPTPAPVASVCSIPKNDFIGDGSQAAVQRQVELLRAWTNTPVSKTSGMCFDVVDSHLNPVRDARVIVDGVPWEKWRVVDGRAMCCSETISPTKTIVIADVVAPGYERFRHAFKVPSTPTSAPLRVMLGPPGAPRLGEVVLEAFTEIVAFTNKHPTGSAEFHAELARLAAEFPESVAPNARPNELMWPRSDERRARFCERIEASPVLTTHSLRLVEKTELTPLVYFFVNGAASEHAIRTALEAAGFDVLELGDISFTVGAEKWRVKAWYRRPLSMDFLRAIGEIEATLPVVSISIDHIVNAELTKTSDDRERGVTR